MSKQLNGPRIARLQQLHKRVKVLKASYEGVRRALVDARSEFAEESRGLDAQLVALLVRGDQ